MADAAFLVAITPLHPCVCAISFLRRAALVALVPAVSLTRFGSSLHSSSPARGVHAQGTATQPLVAVALAAADSTRSSVAMPMRIISQGRHAYILAGYLMKRGKWSGKARGRERQYRSADSNGAQACKLRAMHSASLLSLCLLRSWQWSERYFVLTSVALHYFKRDRRELYGKERGQFLVREMEVSAATMREISCA